MTRLVPPASVVVLIALALPSAAQQPSDGVSAVAALEQALTQVIEQAEPSVVSVARVRPDPSRLDGLRERGETERDQLPIQFGAGAIVAPPQSDKRYVLTAYHVVRGGPVTNRPGSGDGSSLQVWFSNERSCLATIYAADSRCDLAVLKLEERDSRIRPSQLHPLSWTAAAAVHKGQFVVTLGNPYWIARDGSPSADWGIISNLVRRPAVLTPTAGGPSTLLGVGTAIQIEQRLPVGSSGSPVLNLQGQLIGVASSLAAIEGYERSGGFAIPIDASTRWILETLLAGREVEYGFLGLGPRKVSLRDDIAERLGQTTAAEVTELRIGSPAHIAGLRDRDIIISIDGQPTRSSLDLMRQATLHPPETPIQLNVHRGGTELTIKVKLGKWPVKDEEGLIATERRFPLWRGLAVDYPTARDRWFHPLVEIPSAVVITEVATDSPGQSARLQPGEFISHVNRTPVKTPAEFAEAVKSLKGDVTLRLQPTERRFERTADDTGRTVVIKEKFAGATGP